MAAKGGTLKEQKQGRLDWKARAKNIVRAEMKNRDLSYADLAKALVDAGAPQQSESSLRNKVSRGNFTAAFFLEVMFAMRVEFITLVPDGILRFDPRPYDRD